MPLMKARPWATVVRVIAELPLQRADGLVLAGGRGWHHVHHRGQVEVDAGQPQLTAPGPGLLLQHGGGQLPLDQGRRDVREAWSLQLLDLAPLLVGRDEEADPGRWRRATPATCTALVACRSTAMPAVLSPVNSSEPKW